MKNSTEKETCLVILRNPGDFKILKFQTDFCDRLILKQCAIENVFDILRSKKISCILLFFDAEAIPKNREFIRHAKEKFPMTPWIVILDTPDIEYARLCGDCHVEKVLCKDDPDIIVEYIIQLINHHHLKITLAEVGIDQTKKEYSPMLKDALRVIENNYVSLLKVQQIAELLKVSESTLIREFQSAELYSPKQLLLFLKVRHAIKLMPNAGLSMSEIAYSSGFTSPKRMNECFQRTYALSPTQFKEQYMEGDLPENIARLLSGQSRRLFDKQEEHSVYAE